MKRSQLLLLVAVLMTLVWSTSALAASPEQQTAGTAQITVFGASVSAIERNALNQRKALVPVYWETASRPTTSNLVFEQVLPDGRTMNVELPRQNPIVPSSGIGVVNPFPPGEGQTSVRLRVTLFDTGNGRVYDQKEVTVAVGDATTAIPVVRVFSTAAASVRRDQLAIRTARVPVVWAVDNRPNNSNLVFEQVLDDNSVVSVELPRENPFVTSAGSGLAAPAAPKSNAVTTITLRLRLIDLTSKNALAERTLTLAIDDSPAPQPTIVSFTTTATSVDRNALINRTARVPVSWQVDNRPEGTNLVFDQVMADNLLTNVELPRQNPYVTSSGNGVAAPIDPGGAPTKIQLMLRLVDTSTKQTITQKVIDIPVTAPAAPVIKSFASTATGIDRNALANRTARLPVSWQVDNRPNNSNLLFEQILDNGTVVNVELPRTNPIVPSSGIGVAAPVAPTNPATTSIQLRLRVIDLGSQATLAQQTITIPVTGSQSGPAITAFTSTTPSVERAALQTRTARVSVAWSVDNRPGNSNLVFEQVLENNQVLNVELPRPNPIVPSSGVGVAAPFPPLNAATTAITLRLRLINLTTGATLAQQTLSIPISGGQTGANIRSFTTTATNVDFGTLANRTARIPVSWQVDNRPNNSNLVFEQILPDGQVVSVELPRPNPIVSSSGSGVAAAVAPGSSIIPTGIQLRLRLVNLGDNSTLGQREITLPITGQVDPFVQVVNADQCYSSGFAPGIGLIKGGNGKVAAAAGQQGLPVTSEARNGQVSGALQVGEAFTITDGPYCFRYLYASNWTQLFFRRWKVSGHTRAIEGWVNEYVTDSNAATRVLIEVAEPPAGDSPGGGTTTADLAVTSFTANPDPVERGGSLTLNWSVSGPVSQVSISRLSEYGNTFVETLLDSQPATGSGAVTLTGDSITTATFALNASDTNGREVQQNLQVGITCPFTATLDELCPVTQATDVNSAFQSFENGSMAWRGDVKKIYVLFSDGSWQEFDDTWSGQVVDAGVPPEGKLAPQNGFGYVWLNQAGVRERLGWATTPEAAYTAQWETAQTVDAGNVAITPRFTLPDGKVVVLGLVWAIV